jgi:hypothetical protein
MEVPSRGKGVARGNGGLARRPASSALAAEAAKHLDLSGPF